MPELLVHNALVTPLSGLECEPLSASIRLSFTGCSLHNSNEDKTTNPGVMSQQYNGVSELKFYIFILLCHNSVITAY